MTVKYVVKQAGALGADRYLGRMTLAGDFGWVEFPFAATYESREAAAEMAERFGGLLSAFTSVLDW